MKYHGCEQEDEDEATDEQEEKKRGDDDVMAFHLLHTALALKITEMGRRARIFSRISSGKESERSPTPSIPSIAPMGSMKIKSSKNKQKEEKEIPFYECSIAIRVFLVLVDCGYLLSADWSETLMEMGKGWKEGR